MTYWARNAALFFIGIVDVQPELDAALPQGKQRAGRKRETIVAAAHEKAAEQIRPEACQRLPYGEIAGELIEDFEDLRFQIFRLTRLRIKSPAAGPGSTDSPSLTAFKFLPLVMRNGWSRSEQGTDFFGQEVVSEESEGYQGMIAAMGIQLSLSESLPICTSHLRQVSYRPGADVGNRLIR